MIVLLTDFGTRDPFVGIMKGVIGGINPSVPLVDLSHELQPHDLEEASFLLATCSQWFPPEAIFVAVVDPGVGTGRKILLLKKDGKRYLAPNNGILSFLLEQEERSGRQEAGTGDPAVQQLQAWEILPQQYLVGKTPSDPVSHTFHGRDIFAPIAAYLSLGEEEQLFGSPFPLDEVVKLPPLLPVREKERWRGKIIYVDRFGNLVTNFPEQLIHGMEKNRLTFSLGPHRVRGLMEAYGEAGEGQPFAILNSFNLVEIAVREGSAAKILGVPRGQEVILSEC